MANDEWYYAQGGQQHGPVSLDALVAMARSGQLGREDLIWRADFADWRAAGTVPELWVSAAPAASSGGAVPPPPPVYRPVPHGGAGTTNTLAIASIVCGAVSFFTLGCLVSVPGAICGHAARKQIRENPDMYSGDELAVIGLVLNYLNLAVVLGLSALVILGILVSG